MHHIYLLQVQTQLEFKKQPEIKPFINSFCFTLLKSHAHYINVGFLLHITHHIKHVHVLLERHTHRTSNHKLHTF